jgi:hypothetical protein
MWARTMSLNPEYQGSPLSSKSRLSHHYSWIDLHRFPALLIIFFLTRSTVLYSELLSMSIQAEEMTPMQEQ